MPRKKDLPYMTENDIFATRLREVMASKGTNQTKLAAQLMEEHGQTMQRQTLSQYMNGQSKPDTERLAMLCKTLGVSADYLLGLTEVQSADPNFQVACKYTGLTEEAVFCLQRLPSIGNAFSEIIYEYGIPVSHALNDLGDAVVFAKKQHETMKPEIESDPDEIVKFFPYYQRIVENLELALFRFERECRRIPDEIYETSNLLEELNTFVWNSMEAEDGEHQED